MLGYREITQKQASDSGMALVLLLLLSGYFFSREAFYLAAIPVLVLTMSVPLLFKPFAWAWLGLTALLGRVVSLLILGLIYVLLVVPVGVIRRWLGYDSLQLRMFKAGKDSVMSVRNHLFTPEDLEKPY